MSATLERGLAHAQLRVVEGIFVAITARLLRRGLEVIDGAPPIAIGKVGIAAQDKLVCRQIAQVERKICFERFGIQALRIFEVMAGRDQEGEHRGCLSMHDGLFLARAVAVASVVPCGSAAPNSCARLE